MLGWRVCLYVSSTGGPTGASGVGAKAPPADRARSGRLYWVFIHEIHSCTRCPGTNGDVHFLPDLVGVGRQIRDRDRADLDESATIENFDLENIALGDDFAGFLVDAAADGGSSTKEALKDEHGESFQSVN